MTADSDANTRGPPREELVRREEEIEMGPAQNGVTVYARARACVYITHLHIRRCEVFPAVAVAAATGGRCRGLLSLSPAHALACRIRITGERRRHRPPRDRRVGGQCNANCVTVRVTR